MDVIKKDGTREGWNGDKIKEAVWKAAERINHDISNEVLDKVVAKIEDSLYKEVTTKDLHSWVIHYLRFFGLNKIADSYQEYRDYKTTYAKSFEKIKEDADTVLLLGDRENANFDSSLVSTKGSLIKGYLTKELYKQFYLSTREKELIKRGDIYIHDMRDMLMGSFNCCLFDMANVLEGGFHMSNIQYTEPTSVLSALQVIGDITLVATAQQFGGFTIPSIDMTLLPYAKKTLKRATDDMKRLKIKNEDYPWEVLARELTQGFQSLELKLNTVPCSRGDFAFTTLTFGCWKFCYKKEDYRILNLICTILLSVRQNGHGDKHKPVVFPKLVFLFDEDQYYDDYFTQKLFDRAVKCASHCMYPDFLSLTGNYPKNEVARQYKEHNQIVSPMGCRAYLSEYFCPETEYYETVGRCNIGAVSLNLPLIWAIAKREDKDFYDVLFDRLLVIRNFFLKRYDMMRHTKACTNPMCFMEGGLLLGDKNPDDEIGDLVNYMTASFGVTALNELSILATGKTIKEDQSFAKEVLTYLNQKLKEFKKIDGYLYALYGTPAESLCGTQAKQYRDYTGDDQFGEYFTNSFHMHVSEDITPFQKQDYEEDLFHMVNGGHIQYVRIDNPSNIEALKDIILRGMEKGFYQGVNFEKVVCEDCGCHSSNTGACCPDCGSTDVSVVDRVCGYLGYSRVHGGTRMNDAKMAEIRDRKSM